MRIATWNINSIRLRIDNVISFIKKNSIDVLCLQETKTEDAFFPLNQFIKRGFAHSNIRGQKGYNGVAILSRFPFLEKKNLKLCKKNDARHVSVKFKNNICIHNFYVPAGGDVPDTKTNSKFKYKLEFLVEMKNYFKKAQKQKRILVGILILPQERMTYGLIINF